MTKYELVRVSVTSNKEEYSFVRTYTHLEDAVNKCNLLNERFLTEPVFYKVVRFIYPTPYG